MPLIEVALRLLAYVTGAALHIFLASLLVRKLRAGTLERLFFGAVVGAALWHAGEAAALFYDINSDTEDSLFLSVAEAVAKAGLITASAFLFHLGVASGRLPKWLALLGYGLAPVAAWLLEADGGQGHRYLLVAVLTAVALLCVRAARSERSLRLRRFLSSFAIALAIPAVVVLATDTPAVMVWSSLVPALCLIYFVHRYNFLGLLIRRQLAFAFTLGLFVAFYLFGVRRLADFVEDEFEFFGTVTELALIFAAALVWLPLYGWMNRFLSKRAQLYADFSKRLIEEAAEILEPAKRVQFLAEEVGRTFQLKRVLLATAGDARFEGRFGFEDVPVSPDAFGRLESLAYAGHEEFVHTHLTRVAELRKTLEAGGFNYLFPLWYEDRLTGLLLLDSSPRVFMDEDETILLGLCRQISHSIETGKVVEEKIQIERTLVQQEHLAKLGKAAAAIAHEVKNPLSSMKTLAQLMREDDDVRGKYERDLSYMVAEIDRLNGSVQQLLSFSRPAPEKTTDVDVAKLVANATQTLRRQSAERGIAVEYCDGPAPLLKDSHPELIQQIVLNLILNATQASPEGGRVTVEVRDAPEKHLSILVADEGPGIPAEMRERVFEPFVTTKQKGTGLGLAIVRKNVRLLGGEIQLESPIAGGHGTRVTVTLPVP